jgi:hypothetical protein
VSKAGKVLVIAVLLGVFCAGALFAKDKSGIRLGFEFGEPQVALIIRPAPFDFKVGYSFIDNPWLFLSADYRILSGYQLIQFLHLFLGVGLYGQIYFEEPDLSGFGLRIPVGLQVFLLDNVLEFFFELAPTVGLYPDIHPFEHLQGWVGFTILVPRFW